MPSSDRRVLFPCLIPFPQTNSPPIAPMPPGCPLGPTGPTTPEGKLRSSQNARKHGFTATSFAVVRLEDLNEVATNEDPIGKRIKWSRDPNSKAPWMTIVGISGDVKAWRLNAQPLPEMFTPLSQQPQAFLFLAIRTWSADPTPVAGAVRAALRQL